MSSLGWCLKYFSFFSRTRQTQTNFCLATHEHRKICLRIRQSVVQAVGWWFNRDIYFLERSYRGRRRRRRIWWCMLDNSPASPFFLLIDAWLSSLGDGFTATSAASANNIQKKLSFILLLLSTISPLSLHHNLFSPSSFSLSILVFSSFLSLSRSLRGLNLILPPSVCSPDLRKNELICCRLFSFLFVFSLNTDDWFWQTDGGPQSERKTARRSTAVFAAPTRFCTICSDKYICIKGTIYI